MVFATGRAWTTRNPVIITRLEANAPCRFENMLEQLSIHALKNIPLIKAGDDLASLLVEALEHARLDTLPGDILVVAQKIVSKAENRQVRLSDINPSPEAQRLAEEVGKDARLVELILRESLGIVRKAPGVIIVRHRLGFVSANAGIDQSNIGHQDGESALLLPLDPDLSARRLRAGMERSSGRRMGVIISDSMNRPWRLGTIGSAIGSAGLTVLDDRRGQHDLFGRELKVTMINRADSIATAAMLIMGETTERIPAALVRGFPAEDSGQSAADCIRPVSEDLFL
jgi:coenzyme F420-0:L-glutamate ligase/coenzyme F420-1:gamma-L-glutamate ligase